jgi:hypothetical protein
VAGGNPRPILDATANIAGGAALSGRPGVYKGAGGISGVLVAYSLPPEPNNLNEDGPAHVSFWDGLEINPDGSSVGDLTVFRHTIRMQLCLALGRSEIPTALGLAVAFVPLYVAAFAAKTVLAGVWTNAELRRTPGIVESIYPDRLCLEWFLTVTQKEAVTYGAA